MRTQDEIVQRYLKVKDDDILGFKAQVLLCYLDADHVRQFAKPGADLSGWTPRPQDAIPQDAIPQELASYLEFAWGEAEDRRCISAERSIYKLTELAWMLGRDDAVQAMIAAPYPMYGAPKLRALAETLGLPIPTSSTLAEMMAGIGSEDED